ncbi:unnamed protein product [Mytilus coruscus]|uniref:Uncharacterized protein n=1 Tax=Mytilus coruscus TaxID=42192 RepID=A0A6J8E2S8_MYTCO|nr:unnamed protein product [Mytilus coruscus]
MIMATEKQDSSRKRPPNFRIEISVDNSINDEISSYDDLDSINIMTDARHSWRKNAKDTTVVALGEKTHLGLIAISSAGHHHETTIEHTTVEHDKHHHYTAKPPTKTTHRSILQNNHVESYIHTHMNSACRREIMNWIEDEHVRHNLLKLSSNCRKIVFAWIEDDARKHTAAA